MKKNKSIAIRVDASIIIGTGHFMRCLTLALAMKENGFYVRFVTRDLPEYLCSILVEHDIDFTLLDNDIRLVQDGDLAHSSWLGTSQMQDAEATIKALSGQLWDWLVVDHYALDAKWEVDLKEVARKIMVFDDIADRQHDCDILLDQNYYVDMHARYSNKVQKWCKLLLGPRYAILREEFHVMRKHAKPRSGTVKNILVFFGGVDAKNYTGLALKALLDAPQKDFHVDVVVGEQHPCREQIWKTCVDCGYICHIQTSNMAALMLKADLAIGAGGSTSWERCYFGLPTLLFAIAKNQVAIAEALSSTGACAYIGPAEQVSLSVIRDALVKLLENQDRRETMSKHAFSLVDGQGTDRVCLELAK